LKAFVNGAEIFFDVEGSGLKVAADGLVEKPVCVLLHGGPGADHAGYRPWLSPLAEALQLIYVDHRGTGRSAEVALETCTIEKFADDIEELRRLLGIKNWIVLGHSFGGMWALTYAVRYRSSLSHLILVDTAPSYDFWREAEDHAEMWGTPDQKRVYKEVVEGKISTDEEQQKWFKIMLPLYFHGYDSRIGDAFLSRMKGSSRVSQYMWRNVMPNYDVRPRLGEITVPTLILACKYDWITPVSQSELMANKIPNSKFVTFQNSGHFPYIEEQGRFIDTVLDFLGIS
jgi:proline iminopeptidase